MLQNRDKLYKKAEKIDDETLSDKIETNYEIENEKNYDFILVKDVKEFIKEVKERINIELGKPAILTGNYRLLMNVKGIIDELAGDKLI